MPLSIKEKRLSKDIEKRFNNTISYPKSDFVESKHFVTPSKKTRRVQPSMIRMPAEEVILSVFLKD